MTLQTLTQPEKLLIQIQTLPPDKIQEVMDFVEFLSRKYVLTESIPSEPRVNKK